MGARFIHRDAIRTTLQTLLTRIGTLIAQLLCAIGGRGQFFLCGSPSPSDRLKSESDPLFPIYRRRTLTARAGFAGVGKKASAGCGRNLFDPVDV